MGLNIIEKIHRKDSIHTITYDDRLKTRVPLDRTPRRPTFKRAVKGMSEYWDMIRNFQY